MTNTELCPQVVWWFPLSLLHHPFPPSSWPLLLTALRRSQHLSLSHHLACFSVSPILTATMSSSVSTAKLAAAVLESCVNVLHAGYTNRSSGDDNGLQFLLDDVRKLATTVSATSRFWALNPTVRISDALLNVLNAMRVIFLDCSTTLGRVELMLACESDGELTLGSKIFDFKFLRWKMKGYIEAIELAKGTSNAKLLRRKTQTRLSGILHPTPMMTVSSIWISSGRKRDGSR
ncbi:hypothetical protein BJX64DRAFT_78661 [Aspergillus heterothallicus]